MENTRAEKMDPTTAHLLNRISREDFVRIIGPAFEHSPWIAEATWVKRPFETLEHLHAALCDAVKNSEEARQLDLIRAHPDLVGRAALAGSLTSASTAEQATAGLNRLTTDEIALFQKYNEAYRD